MGSDHLYKRQQITGIDEQGNVIQDETGIRGIDNAEQLKVTNATNLANIELAKYQNRVERENWNAQNEYDSPAAQRQRLIDAGLNPLFYSGSIDSGNNQNAAGVANMAVASNPQLPGTAARLNAQLSGLNGANNSLLSLKQLAIQDKRADAEIQQLNSSTEVNRQQAKKISADYHVSLAQAHNLLKDLDVKNADIKVKCAQYDELIAAKREKEANSILASERAQTEKALRDSRLNQIITATLKDKGELEKINAFIVNLNDEHIKNGKSIDAAEMDNIMKFIEMQFKQANLQTEWEKNQAQILKELYGVLAPAKAEALHLAGVPAASGNSKVISGTNNYVGTPGMNYTPNAVYSDKGFSYVNSQ